jgi:hypothetical protein
MYDYRQYFIRRRLFRHSTLVGTLSFNPIKVTVIMQNKIKEVFSCMILSIVISDFLCNKIFFILSVFYYPDGSYF